MECVMDESNMGLGIYILHNILCGREGGEFVDKIGWT